MFESHLPRTTPPVRSFAEVVPFAVRDEGARQHAERLLAGQPYLALTRITCRVRAGVLTLEGCVPSYYLEQLARGVVESVPGISQVRSRIQVSRG